MRPRLRQSRLALSVPIRTIKHAPTLVAALVTSIIFGVSLTLTPSRLTAANHGMDGGDLLAAILSRGVPHPTGYPTYLVFGRLFQLLPFGTPYWRGAMLSSAPAALAAGLFAAWTTRKNNNGVKAFAVGLIAGLAWGTAPVFLSQATIVEVHGLQALFSVLALGWLRLLSQPLATTKKTAAALGLAFAFGLGLGNHVTALVLLPVVLVCLGIAWKRGARPGLIAGQLALLAGGSLVYLYLPALARLDPPVNWGDPRSWEGFKWLVTAQPYQGLLFSLPAASLVERLAAWLDFLRAQLSLPILALAAAGAVWMAEKERPSFWILTWVFLSYSLVSVGYATRDSTVYLIPALLAVAAWVAFAVGQFWERAWRGAPWGIAIGLLAIGYFIARLPFTSRQIDPRGETWPDEFAVDLLKQAPAASIVLTQADPDTFSLWYHHFGLGARPDLAIVAQGLLPYSWYWQTLAHTYPDLKLPEVTTPGDGVWAEDLLNLNPSRPVCRTHLDLAGPAGLAYQCSGASPGG